MAIDYSAPAELFRAKRTKMNYQRLTTAAEAIRYVIEDLRRPKPAVDAASVREGAAESVALAPNVILASGTLPVAALQQITSTVPIVCVNVIDPVGAGLVESLAQPGGSTTGFALFDYSISGKWLELLKQIAPRTTRAVVVRDPSSSAGIG